MYENNVFKWGTGIILFDRNFNENSVVSDLKAYLDTPLNSSEEQKLIDKLKTNFTELKDFDLNFDVNNEISFKIDGKTLVITSNANSFNLSVDGAGHSTNVDIDEIISALKHLTSVESSEEVDTVPLQKSLINDLKNNFPELKNKELKWKDFGYMQNLNFTINNINVSVGFIKPDFTVSINGRVERTTFIKDELVSFLKKKFEENEEVETVPLQKKLIKDLKSIFPDLNTQELKWETLYGDMQNLNFTIKNSNVSVAFHKT